MFRQRLKTLLGSALVLGAITAAPAQAKADEVQQLLLGLVNVNVFVDGDVGDIYVNDVNVLSENFVLVNVEDVLNGFEIAILDNLISNNVIASCNQWFLNDVLSGNNILDANQTVVGILSDQDVVYAVYQCCDP